jgi:hypothetical protein
MRRSVGILNGKFDPLTGIAVGRNPLSRSGICLIFSKFLTAASQIPAQRVTFHKG